MADNTAQTGTDTIATDDVTTLNGGVSSGVKVQRTKVTYGDDGTARDVSTSFPLPVIPPDAATSGTLSATDAVVGPHGGAGVLLSGTPTASSYVALALTGGGSAFVIQATGTLGGGTVWFECSANSTNGVDGSWTTLSCRLIGTNGSTISDSTTVAGLFRGDTAGMAYLRVRVTGATSPSIAVVIRASSGVGPLALNAGLPASTNTIGGVNGGTLITTTGTVAAGATGTVGPLNIGTSGNVTFTVKNTVAASAWAGAPVIVFEQSDDSTSWGPLVVVRSDNQVAAATHVLPAGTANGALMFDAPAESVNYVRARVTTGPTTNGITMSIAAGGMPFSPVVTSVTSPIQSQPLGTTTGTTPALTGQVGRVVRATANVAQATAATLIAAPAVGTRIYVTNITCANEGATLTVLRLFAGTLPAAAGAVAVINDCFDFPIAATGGGATVNFARGTEWALPVATALSFAVTVATTWDVTVSYYVAA